MCEHYTPQGVLRQVYRGKDLQKEEVVALLLVALQERCPPRHKSTVERLNASGTSVNLSNSGDLQEEEVVDLLLAAAETAAHCLSHLSARGGASLHI